MSEKACTSWKEGPGWGFCYVKLVFPRDFSYLVQELQRPRLAMEAPLNAESYVLNNPGLTLDAWATQLWAGHGGS